MSSDDLARYVGVPYADFDLHQTLVPVSELAHPPVLVDRDAGFIDRTESGDLIIEFDTVYYDPDTPTDSLEVVYHWTINGEDAGNDGSALLSSEQLSDDDFVTVFITISDGTTTIRTDEESTIY